MELMQMTKSSYTQQLAIDPNKIYIYPITWFPPFVVGFHLDRYVQSA